MDTVATAATFSGPVYGATAAARRLSISPSYLHRLTRLGVVRPSIPSADGRRFYSQADLDALAARLGRNGAAGAQEAA